MGLLTGAIAGAAGAVEETTKYALRAMMDEEKAKRIAEYSSKLKSDEDLTTRARNKGDAADERGRVAGLLTGPVPVSQGDGMLAPATGDEAELSKVSRKPTNDEMVGRAIEAGDLKTATEVGKLDDKEAANATRMKIAELQQSAAFAKMDAQYQLGVMKLDSMLAKAEASGKSPTQVQQIEYLIKNGMTREKATDLVYHSEAKVGEYVTTQTEGFDDKGNKVVTTKKVKPGSEKSAPSGRVRVFVPGKGFVDQQQ